MRQNDEAPRVLLIEDDPVTRRILAASLEQSGFEVEAVPTLARARAVVQAPVPALIVTEATLPDGPAEGFVRELRRDPRYARLQAVALTTMSPSGVRNSDVFFSVLVKPVEPSVLLATLRECLGDPDTLAPQKDVQVLVVEDEPLMRRLLAGHLRRAGYIVRAAQDGPEALSIARRWAPDLVVADLAMPEMRGDVLARQLRRTKGLGRLPVVLVTAGLGDDLEPMTARQAGVSAIVAKSNDPRTLLEAVASALQDPVATEPDEPGAHEDVERLLHRVERQARLVNMLEEAIALQEAELNVIAGIADAVQRARSAGDLLSTTLQRACDLRFVDVGFAWLVQGDELVLEAAVGNEGASGTRVAETSPALHQAVRAGALRMLPSREPTPNELAVLDELGPLRSALLVPVRAGREPAGLIALGSRREHLGSHAWAFGQTVQSQVSQSLTLRRTMEAITAAARHFKAVAETLHEALVTVDREGFIVFANAVARTLWAPADPVGQRLDHWLTAEDGGALREGAFDGQLRNEFGRQRPMRVHGASLPGLGPLGVFAYTLRDVTESRRHAAWLRRLASEDPLTGLPNRRAFESALETALGGGGRRRDRPVAVLFIDLDGFKAINDTAGHDAGDLVLQEFARRLRERLRSEELVARIGGDEFAILVKDTVLPEVRIIGPVVCEQARAVGEALGYVLDASVGAALGAPGAISPAELLERADQAMYVAKRAGGGALEVSNTAD